MTATKPSKSARKRQQLALQKLGDELIDLGDAELASFGLDERIDAAALKSRALSAGAGYQPGSVFSSTGGYGNYIRLSFAHFRREQIREGISRLAGVLSRA